MRRSQQRPQSRRARELLEARAAAARPDESEAERTAHRVAKLRRHHEDLDDRRGRAAARADRRQRRAHRRAAARPRRHQLAGALRLERGPLPDAPSDRRDGERAAEAARADRQLQAGPALAVRRGRRAARALRGGGGARPALHLERRRQERAASDREAHLTGVRRRELSREPAAGG